MKKIIFLFSVLVFVHAGLKAQPVVVHIENKALKVKLSSFGAELQSVKSAKTLTEYLWQGDEEHWEDKAPVMFPVNVKFKDTRYTSILRSILT